MVKLQRWINFLPSWMNLRASSSLLPFSCYKKLVNKIAQFNRVVHASHLFGFNISYNVCY